MGLSGSGRPASLTFEGPRRTTARVMSRAAAPMRLNWWIRVERRKRSNEMAEITENRPTMPFSFFQDALMIWSILYDTTWTTFSTTETRC